MLKVDIGNLMADAVGDANGLTDTGIQGIEALAPSAHERFQAWRMSEDALFYDLVFDGTILNGIETAAKEVAGKFDDVVVLGIGGSALGLKCAAQALLPPFWNILDKKARKGRPRLFVCDNIDPETFSALLTIVELKKTCFIVISKSGKTTETAAQFFIILEKLKKGLGKKWADHFIMITDPASGELRPFATEHKITAFAIPPKLGGRFSVLSPVGTFPAACLGLDVKGLVEGARQTAQRCSSASFKDNDAYRIGGAHFWMDAKKKKSISVMMPYSDGLLLAADWYAQLWGESLGKNGKGSTPVKALGATDQHSQLQLYMEGPADKVITFVGALKFRVDAKATRIETAPDYFKYLNGHDLGSILKAERTATAQALAKAGRPNMTVTFPVVDAQHLGEFFMLYELATMYAGALYGCNPFDQTGVERGKVITREILEK